MLRRFNALLGWMSKLLLALAAISILALMFHICADVAGKYLFDRPIGGTLEVVAWYYMVACVFLPVGFVQIRRQHLMVEMFTLGLNTRQTALLDAFVALLSSAYVALLTWLVFIQAVDSTRHNEIQDITFMDLPVWPSRWILPVSFGLMTLILIAQAINDLTFALTGRGQPTLVMAKQNTLSID